MPVGEVFEKVFIEYADKPLPTLLIGNGGSVARFQKELRRRSFRIRGEILKEIKDNVINHSNYQFVFSNLISKITRLVGDRFPPNGDDIHYKYDKLDLIISKDGREMHQFAYYLHEYCQDIIKLFSEYIEKFENSIIPEMEIIYSRSKNKKKRGRIPLRQSFQLTKPEVNLNLVHKILRDSGFIDKSTSFDNFSMVFSGDPVSPKVIWINANSLQYFIQEIIKGKGVKNPNEGKWERTIKCFTKPNGEYNVTDLKDTKPPVSSKTNMLDLAIEVINGIK